MDEDLLNNINDKNKLQRRKALSQLQNIFQDRENVMLELYNYYETALISALSDESEANRYKVCVLLETVLQKKIKPESMPKYVIPTIHHRLCSKPVIEDCEENRLEFLTLIEIMIDLYQKDIYLYTNELCDIVCSGLKDNYPEVVLKCCDMVINLSVVLKLRFPMFCNSFLNNLIHCISKYRLKVRVKALKTLGCLYTCGNICEFDEVNTVLSKCFTDVPLVRLALLSFGYSLCIHMPDRYSYWSKILPFVLFGLRDNDEEIKEKSLQFWKEIGEQYERENEIKAPFYTQAYMDLCPEEVRDLDFSVGCCTLIERNFHKMLEKLVEDAQFWQEEVRLNALKLLIVCVLGLKENCLQYSKKIIDLIGFSINDHDPRINKESLLCAKVLGMYLPPDLYIPLVKSGLWGETDGFFLLFSSLTETTPLLSLNKYSQQFLEILSFPNIGTKISPVKQEIIINVYKRLFCNCKIENFDAVWFLSLLYVSGMNHCEVKENNERYLILELVARSFEHDSVEDFISKYIKPCLQLLDDDNIWFDEDEPSLCVFLYLSLFEGFHKHLDTVSKFLNTKLDFESAPLVAFAVLRGLTEVLKRVSCSEDQNLIEKWCNYLVDEHILNMLSFKQFRTGESLRLASVSSLLSIVKFSIENATVYQAIKKCFGFVEGLIVEDFFETRILTCHLIENLLTKFGNFIEPQKTFNFIELLMKRLDDMNVKVRRVASDSLANCLRSSCISASVRDEENLRKIINNVAIYMREDDTFIQKNVAGILNDIKVMNENVLESELRCTENEDILKTLNTFQLN